jgi:hypothetical protein
MAEGARPGAFGKKRKSVLSLGEVEVVSKRLLNLLAEGWVS